FRKESPLLAPRPPGRGGPPRKRHPPGARPDAAGDRVVRIDDREIVLALVREDAFLRRRVLLDARVAVEMIGRDVRQDGDVRPETLDGLELKRGKLADEVTRSAVAEEPGKRRADVPGEGDGPRSEAQDLGDPRRRR